LEEEIMAAMRKQTTAQCTRLQRWTMMLLAKRLEAAGANPEGANPEVANP